MRYYASANLIVEPRRTSRRALSLPAACALARFIIALALAAVPVSAANAQAVDTVAKTAFGQPNLTTATSGTSQTELSQPWNAAYDSAGRLYIADFGNNRVVRHDNPFTDTLAEAVYGQPGFTTKLPGTTRTGLNGPSGVFVDNAGRLYIAEYGNHRIVRHDNPLADTNPEAVYGQPDFNSASISMSRTGLNKPIGLCGDSAGRLYIADYWNSRVLRHDNPLGDTIPEAVYGQTNFTSSALATTDTGLNHPTGVILDIAGRLYISDFNNNRVVRHNNPLADTIADWVYGQPNFASKVQATSVTGLYLPVSCAIDSSSRLYILDYNNNRFLRHDNPLVDTVPDALFGQPDFTTRNPATSATGLNSPFCVAVDSTSAIVVADRYNNRVVGYAGLFVAPGAAPNNAPVISALPAQSRSEDTAAWTVALSGFGSDSDIGDTLYHFWSVTGGGGIATVSMDDSRTLRIAPNADTNGTETVTLRLSDNKDTATRSLAITLTAVNDTPRAGTNSRSAAMIRPTDSVFVSITGSTDTDIATNGDTLFYLWSIVSGPIGAFTAFADSTASASTYFLPVAGGDGIGILKVTVRDLAGASVSETVSFLIDNIAPDSFAGTSPATPLETTSTTIDFAWSAARDTGAGVASYRLQISTSSVFASLLVDSAAGLGLAGIRTLPANDTYYWRVAAVDSVGNTGVTTTRIVKIDTAAPSTPSGVSPRLGVETNAAVIVLDWTASSDSLVGLASYRFQIDTSGTFASFKTADSIQAASASETGIDIGSGLYYWRVQALDGLGNASPFSATETFIVNRSGPSILSVSISASDSRFFSPDSTLFTSLNDTVYFNNVGAGANQIDTILVTASAAARVLFPQGFGEAGLSDTQSPFLYAYSIEAGLTDTVTKFVAYDTAGNAETATINWVRDVTAPPAPALTLPVESQVSGDSKPTFSWARSTDTQAGTRGYRIQIASDANFSVIVESSALQTATTYPVLNVLADSRYFWRVVAFDSVGNYETSAIRSFFVDSVTPSIRSIGVVSTASAHFFDDTPVTPGWTADTVWFNPTRQGAGQTVTITARVIDGNETGINGTSIFTIVQDSNIGLDTEVYTLSYTIPQDSASATLLILASDQSGKRDTAFVRFEADTAAPVLGAPTFPADGYETSASTVTLRWAAASDTGSRLRSYRVQIATDTAFTAPATDTVITATSLATTVPTTSRWYWRVSATDNVNNTDTTAARSFVLDTGAPLASTLLAPAADHDTNRATIAFAWSAAADSLTNIDTYRLQVDTSNTFTLLVKDSFAGTSTAGTLVLAPNDTYFWRVTAIDRVGNVVASAGRRLRVDTVAPSGLALQTPTASIDTMATTINFTWSASADALTGVTAYRLQVDTANAFTSLVADSAAGLALAGSLALAANDTYYWRVVAVDSASNTETSASRAFRIDTVGPSGVSLQSPAAGTETRAVTIAFAWSGATDSVAGVASYRLQIDTANTFTSLVVDSNAGLSLTGVRTLAANDSYYWRVTAFDSAGNSSSTTGRLLVVDTRPPTSPDQVSPAAGARLSVAVANFTWAASSDTGSGLAGYRLQVDTANTFATPLFDSATGFDTGGTLTLVMDTYYWRVLAADDAGNTTTTASRQVVVDTRIVDTTAPSAAPLVAPANGTETNAVSALFVWTAATDTGRGVHQYLVEVDTQSNFAAPLVQTVAADSPATSATVTLAANDTYYWRVIVVDFSGNRSDSGATAETRVIVVDTVAPTAPTLASPAAGAETTRASIRFAWNASTETMTGIRDYRLQVSSNADFSASLSLPPDTFEVTLIDSYIAGATETTPLYLFNTVDTFYWRVSARDEAGNVSAWSVERIFVRVAPTETQLPLSVAGFRITTLESGVLRLSWDPSPSPDVVQYVLHWDSGVGAGENLLLAVLNTRAGDTGVYDIGPLPTGIDYSFRLTPLDSAGNFGASAIAIGRVDTKVYTFARPAIVKPVAGDRLPLANRVQVLASLDGTSAEIAAVSTLTFQVRLDPGGAWTSMAASTGVTNNANPITTSVAKDEVGFYRFVWNATSLTLDSYEIRVIATSAGGETRASTAVGIRFVDTSTESVTTYSTVAAESFTQFTMINVNRTETIAITNNADTQSCQIVLPLGAFGNALDTANVYIIVSIAHASRFDTGFNGTSDARALDVVEVRLSNGDTLLSGGRTATVTLTFRDDNLDGFVDGSRVRWNTLRLYRHTGLTGGRWEERPIIARGDPSAGVAGFLQTTTEHFSFFQLVGTAASANLSNFMVAPNPYRPNDASAGNGQNYTGAVGTGVYFLNLPTSVRIEVYTLTGGKVFNYSTSNSTGQVQWDVKNEDNRPVASGVYLYVITDLATNQRVTGKLAVIR
jgi:sugar lactone lactonase YvrE